MATIINNPVPTPPENVTVIKPADSNLGWAIAVIVLLAVLAFGAYIWTKYYRVALVPTPTSTASMNVILPATSESNSQNSGAISTDTASTQ